MEFPSYVPHAVRVSMAARLEGDRIEASGWISALANAEAELLRVQQMQQDHTHDKDVSNKLRIEFTKATEHRDLLAAEVGCLQRLAYDARMQSAYARLVNLPDVTDANLCGFIHAAWAAMLNYTKYRDRMSDAADLASKVADAAGVLAGLLERAEASGWHRYFPSEFFNLSSLMEKTDHSPGDRDFHMWPGMRAFILGEREPSKEPPSEPRELPTTLRNKVVTATNLGPLDPKEETRDMLSYAWKTAPSMAKIIATMQREAQACTPAESGFIGAALASQKKNRKFEYLRAFGTLLRDEHRIELNADIMNAMAATATVVLNEPDLDVTYDDVRKALAAIRPL
jgi:hypothetical protein